MAVFLENIGLGFFDEEESILGLFNMAVAKGKLLMGYNNISYINYLMGDAQLTSTAILNDEDETFNVIRTDTHGVGRSVWKVKVIDVLEEDSDYKKIVVKNQDGTGLAVVNVIASEVLPSYLPDEEITMQMVAFPIDVQYFKDEDDYASIYPTGANGGKLLLGEGTVFPYGLLDNKNGENSVTNDLVSVWGKIKGVYYGAAEFENYDREECPHYIRCIIETEFGELEVVHSLEVLEENNNLENIEVGCICSVQCVLSGDVAIYDYDNGIVKDHENNLHALAYSFVKGNAERIKCILSDELHYYSEVSGDEFREVDSFIEKTKRVQENRNCVKANYATIVEILPQDETHQQQTQYEVGERCLVLRYDDESEYSSIVFLENDEKGNIKTINISKNPRYIFKVDDTTSESELIDDNAVVADTLTSMIMRTRLSLKLSGDLNNEEIIEKVNNSNDLKAHAEEAVCIVLKHEDKENALKNALIYFYILGFYNALKGLKWSLEIADEFNKPVNLRHYGEFQRLMREAYDLAGRFYKDVRANEGDENYREELVGALALAEFLGRHLADLVRDTFEYSVIEVEQEEPMQWCYSAKKLEKELGEKLRDKSVQSIYVSLSGYLDSYQNDTDRVDLSFEAGECIVVFNDIVLEIAIHTQGQLAYRFVPKDKVNIKTFIGAVPAQCHGIENAYFDIKNHDISYNIEGSRLQKVSVMATYMWAFSDIGQDKELLEESVQKNDLPAEIDLLTDKCNIRIIGDEFEYYSILLEDNEE